MSGGFQTADWITKTHTDSRGMHSFENISIFEIANNIWRPGWVHPDCCNFLATIGDRDEHIRLCESIGYFRGVIRKSIFRLGLKEPDVPFFQYSPTRTAILYATPNDQPPGRAYLSTKMESDVRALNVPNRLFIASHRGPADNNQAVREKRDGDIRQFGAAKPWMPDVFTFGGLALVCIGAILAAIGSRRENDDVLELIGIVILASGWFLGYYMAMAM